MQPIVAKYIFTLYCNSDYKTSFNGYVMNLLITNLYVINGVGSIRRVIIIETSKGQYWLEN